MISSIFSLFADTRKSCPLLDHRYRLYMTLGEGRHARVKLAFDEKTKRHVAIKMVPATFTELQVSLLFNEVKALKYLKKGAFPSILDFNFFGDIELPHGKHIRTVYYAMNVEENGEFYRYLELTGSLSEPTARVLFRGLLEGVRRIHDRFICHRDIKTENILVTRSFELKLCDFGSCSSYCKKMGKGGLGDEIRTPMEAVGSPEYNAPEINYGTGPLDSKSLQLADVFSIGCALFLIVVNSLPFGCASLQDPYYKRICGSNTYDFWKIFDKEGNKYSADFKDLFEKMTKFDPFERIKLHEIFEHPWMTDMDVPNRSKFEEEMRLRGEQVSEYYRKRGMEHLSKIKSGKGQFLEEQQGHPGLSDSLEDYLYSLKPKLMKLASQGSHYSQNEDSEVSSSDSSSLNECKKYKMKKKPKKKYSDCLKHLSAPTKKLAPLKLQKESSSESSCGFYSDSEFKE